MLYVLLASFAFAIRLMDEPIEITEDDRRRAEETFRYPLRQDRSVIVSMRWWKLHEQMSHFLFGAALAYALNRSFQVEMRRYPLSSAQPALHFAIKDIPTHVTNPPSFTRLRVARELFCKSETELQANSSEPLLVRNFDDISSLYGNHFISQRLKSLFGMHAGYFLMHRYIELPETSGDTNFVGVEAQSFDSAKKAAHMRDPTLIAGNFSAAVARLTKDMHIPVRVMSNDSRIVELMQDVEPLSDDINGFAQLVAAKYFIGTYRSRLSNLINTMRGRKGLMLNTDTGNVLGMSNYQAGVLSPYEQNVEEFEFTVNEKLRSCQDNIDDLRDVLHHFVL